MLIIAVMRGTVGLLGHFTTRALVENQPDISLLLELPKLTSNAGIVVFESAGFLFDKTVHI